MYSLEYEGIIFLLGVGFMLLINLLVQIGAKIKLSKKTLKILELEETIDSLQHELDLEHDEKIQLLVINAGLKAKKWLIINAQTTWSIVRKTTVVVIFIKSKGVITKPVFIADER